jgi:polyisoprenoid-binding protein YceI
MNMQPSAKRSIQKSSLPRAFLAAISIVLVLAAGTAVGCAPTEGAASPAGQPAQESASALPFSENSALFEILPAESEARFLIDEILRGEPKRVVGATNDVSGQIGIDFADPATAAVGPIQVNARTLETDNGFRNRAIQNRILLAGIYEFITFTPTAVNGLPDKITIGQPLDFEIEGDLTITTITQPVTFQATVVPVSDTRLQGSAVTTIQRGDFDLVVPSATGVAAVGEEVALELDFTAAAVE